MPCSNCGNTRLSRKSIAGRLADGYWYCGECNKIITIPIRKTREVSIGVDKGPKCKRLIAIRGPGGFGADDVEDWT